MTTGKRIIAGILLCCGMLTGAAAAQEPDIPYADVPRTHWAAHSIAWCTHYGLNEGDGLGNFGLGQTMSRAACVTVLCRLMGWEMVTPVRGSFADNMDSSAWYYAAVETAAAHGALQMGEYCRPLEGATREELTAMLLRAMGYAALAGTVTQTHPFTDVTTSGGYITLACEMGLVRGTSENTFSPQETVTREMAATIFLRAYDRLYGTLDVREVRSIAQVPDNSLAVAGIYETAEGQPPIAPRIPIESLYHALQTAGDLPIAMYAIPYYYTRGADGTWSGTALSQRELNTFLTQGGEMGRSTRHKSSYLYWVEDDGTEHMLWYESEVDIMEKIQFCSLMGAKQVYLVRPKL